MNERTEQILEAAIQEFIDIGEPVSSGWLYKKYDFGIKPAMIRLELDALEEDGYLGQPYHSAGRVPTDSGYEFYVERALGPLVRTSRQLKADPSDSFKNLSETLSVELGLLSVAADLVRDEVYKSGLEALVSSLDWEDHEEIRSVIHDFEAVDERLSQAVEKMRENDGSGYGTPQVFIGKKSPVTQSENLSVIGGNYQIGDAAVSIFVIGPKRMDYKKVIRVFRNL